jgi:hypothetical protein
MRRLIKQLEHDGLLDLLYEAFLRAGKLSWAKPRDIGGNNSCSRVSVTGAQRHEMPFATRQECISRTGSTPPDRHQEIALLLENRRGHPHTSNSRAIPALKKAQEILGDLHDRQGSSMSWRTPRRRATLQEPLISCASSFTSVAADIADLHARYLSPSASGTNVAGDAQPLEESPACSHSLMIAAGRSPCLQACGRSVVMASTGVSGVLEPFADDEFPQRGHVEFPPGSTAKWKYEAGMFDFAGPGPPRAQNTFSWPPSRSRART